MATMATMDYLNVGETIPVTIGGKRMPLYIDEVTLEPAIDGTIKVAMQGIVQPYTAMEPMPVRPNAVEAMEQFRQASLSLGVRPFPQSRPSVVGLSYAMPSDDPFGGVGRFLKLLWRRRNHDQILAAIDRLLAWACKVTP